LLRPSPPQAQPLPMPGRAVVTGACGFIGSHVTDSLLAAGVTVIAVDRRDPDHDPVARANLSEVLDHPGLINVTADLRTCAIEPLLLDADVVFHLAALPGVRGSWGAEFADYVACNLFVTQRLMNAAVRLRIPRVVLASSSSVYGPTDGSPSSETVPPRPASPYGITKLAAEQLCLAHAARPGNVTNVVALRYFTVYGPRQRSDMFIHRVLNSALGGPPVTLYGAGQRRRDFTNVTDAVSATLAAARAPVSSGVLNVGVGHSTPLTDILRITEQLTGTHIPVVQVDPCDGDVHATLADPTRVRAVLGWAPQVDLTTGITRQLEWLTSAKQAHAVATAP
jgi:UDP-glucuronate 4-epimerase